MGNNRKKDKIDIPSFLGIGAPKTGTTWLSYCLSQHSRIWIPPVKELHFFNRYENSSNQFLRTFYRGLTRFAKETLNGRRMMRPHYLFYYIWYALPLQNYALFMLFHMLIYPYVFYREVKKNSDNLDWYNKFFLGRLKLNPEKWYVSLFEPTRKQICGEFTTGYYRLSDSSIDYMLSFNKEMRIIYLIRNPIERDWSHINMLTGSKQYGSKVLLDNRMKHPRGIFPASDYLGTLKRYLKYLAPDKLFLGFYEDILFHPNRFMAAVQEFLGVSEEKIIQEPRLTGGYKGIKSDYAVYLAQLNLSNVQEMASIFGGYTKFWLDVASELCKTYTTIHSDETFISTPFATNDLWSSRWECSGAKDFQSGPLSSLPCVNKLIA